MVAQTTSMKHSHISENPFKNSFLRLCDLIGGKLIRIWWKSGDLFLSYFIKTTLESGKELLFHRIVHIPLGLICTIITFPFMILGLIFWIVPNFSRKSVRVRNSSFSCIEKNCTKSYGFATLNLGIGPESLTRFNNMRNSKLRNWQIANNLKCQQQHIDFHSSSNDEMSLSTNETNHFELNSPPHIVQNGSDMNHSNFVSPYVNSAKQFESFISQENSDDPVFNCEIKIDRENFSKGFDNGVVTSFPHLDFLLIQEMFDMKRSREFIKEIEKVFPFTAYDAVVRNCVKIFPSGLMIASRYPIINCHFYMFKNAINQCKYASKGLLAVKVLLKKHTSDKNVVGYIFTTHLQAYQGTLPLHSLQMDELLEYSKQFKSETKQKDEIVAFDILGGDFNCDNMSPVHKEEWHHSLFKHYIDVCRIEPGMDADWTVGSDFRQLTMNDGTIDTPSDLRSALLDPIKRQLHIINADLNCVDYSAPWVLPDKDEEGEYIITKASGKRRIDILLINLSSPVQIKKVYAVTQLAGLIDHIPYHITVDVKFL